MVDAAFFKVSAWHPVDPKLMLAKLKKEIARLPVGLWIIDSGIAPVDLYTYLHARFGAPNGFGMKLKTATSDNLLHWHWSLQYQDRVIEDRVHGALDVSADRGRRQRGPVDRGRGNSDKRTESGFRGSRR